MKKLTALFLALVLCLGLSATASAAYAPYSFTSSDWMTGEDVTITFESAIVSKTTIMDSEATVLTLDPNNTLPSTVTSVCPLYENSATDSGLAAGGWMWPGNGPTVGDMFRSMENEAWGKLVYIQVYADEPIYLALGEAAAPAAPTFDDVKATDYFYESVSWAVANGITNGTSAATFSPGALCTKAHILTFVWRAKDGLEYPAASPYTDLNETEYFYNAAMWAFVNDLDPTDGGFGSAFNPDAPYTRANTVQLLWNIAGKPQPTTTVNFTDVAADAPYAQAVAWAVEQGITNGTSATTFSPDATCTRGQIVTFLYRALA